MASQQVNRSTTSQVVEAQELKILYERNTSCLLKNATNSILW